MRTNIESIGEGDEEKMLRLLSAMVEYDASDDPVYKERLIEEIRQLKKELVSKLTPFKTVDCIVAGDKDVEKAEFVVCANDAPDAFRVKGTVTDTCAHCGTAVLLSPDSPKGPPKLCFDCFDCAVAYGEKRNAEEEQDSLGA